METPERYIKNAENFLKYMVFEKYLPGRYKKPIQSKEKPKNAFCDFEQHEYDFDAIERSIPKNAKEGEKYEQI